MAPAAGTPGPTSDGLVERGAARGSRRDSRGTAPTSDDSGSAGSSGCGRRFRTPSGAHVRCGSRVRSVCPSCAELYRGDWAAIARSGVFEAPATDYRFYLLTLTAPSFGRVHRVPRGSERKRCRCRVVHDAGDSDLRGVPLEPNTYDYAGQVAWNRDSGLLWDRTRRRLRDRWESVEFFIVREWQDRGVLHLHVLVRIARAEPSTRDAIRDAAASAVAFSKVDGALVGWGDQVDVRRFRVGGDGARTIWYLSKALNYVVKDTAREALAGQRSRASSRVWRHLIALDVAARSMRCSPACVPGDCQSRVHDRYGARSHVVSATRRTRHRPGWSFTGLTRGVQRQTRREWAARTAPPAQTVPRDLVVLANLLHRDPRPPAGAVP